MSDKPRSLGELRRQLVDGMGAKEGAQPSRLRPLMRIAAPALALAVVAVVAIALIGTKKSRTPLTLDAAVAQLAQAAIATPTEDGGKYLYVRSIETGRKGGAALLEDGRDLKFGYTSDIEQERWVDADGNGAVVSAETNAHFDSEKDARAAREIRNAEMKQRGDLRELMPVPPLDLPDGGVQMRKTVCLRPMEGRLEEFVRESSGINDLIKNDTLPTDATAAYSKLLDGLKGRPAKELDLGNGTLWSGIESALRVRSNMTGEQRATLLKTLAEIPGTKVIPGEKDPQGRAAIGLSRNIGRATYSVWFDPKTAVAIYSETRDHDDELITRYILEEQKFVDAMPRYDGPTSDEMQKVVDCGQ